MVEEDEWGGGWDIGLDEVMRRGGEMEKKWIVVVCLCVFVCV